MTWLESPRAEAVTCGESARGNRGDSPVDPVAWKEFPRGEIRHVSQLAACAVALLPELEAEARRRQGEHLRSAERDDHGRAKSAPTGADLAADDIPPEKQTSSADRATARAAAKTGASPRPGRCVQPGHVAGTVPNGTLAAKIRASESRSKALRDIPEGFRSPASRLDTPATIPIRWKAHIKRPRAAVTAGGMASETKAPTQGKPTGPARAKKPSLASPTKEAT